jgi:hypothetical protein
VARFVVRPDGFARSITRTAAEVVRERFQARQQRRREVVPRVRRSWTFAVLRAASNGVLRDMNVAMVGRQMLRGARSIYVDFVDYDEVAHHAGGNRIEALQVLQSLDQVLSILEELANHAPRRYHFVILSDHGQSQGAPFEERYGRSLGALCSDLTSETVASLEENVESWGRVESVVDDLAGDSAVGGQTAARTATRMQTRSGADREPSQPGDLVVLGSGNLGLVYARGSKRLTREDIDERWPRLIPGLAASPGIGFVAVMSRDGGPLVMGADGYRWLRPSPEDVSVGVDPLAAYDSHAAWAVLQALEMPEAPDIYVNSAVDASTLEVSALEDLVGAHGGLGGWQDRGLLIAPCHLVDAGPPIVGAEDLHDALFGVLERLGHRAHLPSAIETANR